MKFHSSVMSRSIINVLSFVLDEELVLKRKALFDDFLDVFRVFLVNSCYFEKLFEPSDASAILILIQLRYTGSRQLTLRKLFRFLNYIMIDEW